MELIDCMHVLLAMELVAVCQPKLTKTIIRSIV